MVNSMHRRSLRAGHSPRIGCGAGELLFVLQEKVEAPETITDAELLLAWSDGGRQASFRALVEKYLGLVQGVALRRTGDPGLAGDISQAVFARLAAKASRVASQPSVAGWLDLAVFAYLSRCSLTLPQSVHPRPKYGARRPAGRAAG